MDHCKVCQKPFPRKYRRAGKRKIYCSMKCRYADEYIERVCKTCGVSFRTHKLSKRKDYCSVPCIQRYPCLLCGKMIVGRVFFQSHKKGKEQIQYCSRLCASIAHSARGTKNYVVKGFAATLVRLGKIACERCGFDDPDGLTVHHRDRDRKNNSYANLETLCGTCHELEHNRGAKKRQAKVRVATLLARYKRAEIIPPTAEALLPL